MSALVWWLIPLVACSGALIYVWWSISKKQRRNTYQSMTEYENFRAAFRGKSPEPNQADQSIREINSTPQSARTSKAAAPAKKSQVSKERKR
jgi:hypothetical protein